MKNSLFSEIEQSIKSFDVKLLTDVKQVTVDNTSDTSIFIEFSYIDYKDNGKQYFIGIMFENVILNSSTNVDLFNLLNMNSLSFEDISISNWERINWIVTDSDDDGVVLFSFYCENVSVKYVRARCPI